MHYLHSHLSLTRHKNHIKPSITNIGTLKKKTTLKNLQNKNTESNNNNKYHTDSKNVLHYAKQYEYTKLLFQYSKIISSDNFNNRDTRTKNTN